MIDLTPTSPADARPQQIFVAFGNTQIGAGNGAPTSTTVPAGAYYFRSDSPGGTTHIYYCASPGNWVAIA